MSERSELSPEKNFIHERKNGKYHEGDDLIRREKYLKTASRRWFIVVKRIKIKC